MLGVACVYNDSSYVVQRYPCPTGVVFSTQCDVFKSAEFIGHATLVKYARAA